MFRRAGYLAAYGIAAILAGGCTQENKATPSRPALAKDHWIYDPDLRELMSRLILEQPWPERLGANRSEIGEEQSRRILRDARNLGDGLIEASLRIPGLVADIPMTEADRRAFEAQALTMRNQAKTLKRVAIRGDPGAVQTALSLIDATCSTCHTRFRDFSGMLGPRQAEQKAVNAEAVAGAFSNDDPH